MLLLLVKGTLPIFIKSLRFESKDHALKVSIDLMARELIMKRRFFSILMDHFRNIYQNHSPSLNIEDWNGWDLFDKRLSTTNIAWISRPFTASEIHKVAFQIGDTKALGQMVSREVFSTPIGLLLDLQLSLLLYLFSTQVDCSRKSIIPSLLLSIKSPPQKPQEISNLLAFAM